MLFFFGRNRDKVNGGLRRMIAGLSGLSGAVFWDGCLW